MTDRPINLTKLRELIHTVERDYTAQDLNGTDLIVRVMPDNLFALIETVEAAAALDAALMQGPPPEHGRYQGQWLALRDNLARFTFGGPA